MTSRNKKILCLGVLVLLALGTYGALRWSSHPAMDTRQPLPPLEEAPLSEQADVPSNDDFFSKLEQNEENLIARGGSPQVARDGKTLTIRGPKGAGVVFKDCLDCGPEKDIEHYFVSRFNDPPAVLIYRQLYEGDDYVLVTMDGTAHPLPSYPVFSPNKKSFVVVSASEAFNWNGLEMWDQQGGHYQRTFRYDPKVYEVYRLLGWEGNDRVRLEFSTYSDGDSGSPICRAAEIRRASTGWERQALAETREEFCPFTDEWFPEVLRRSDNSSSEE